MTVLKGCIAFMIYILYMISDKLKASDVIALCAERGRIKLYKKIGDYGFN